MYSMYIDKFIFSTFTSLKYKSTSMQSATGIKHNENSHVRESNECSFIIFYEGDNIGNKSVLILKILVFISLIFVDGAFFSCLYFFPNLVFQQTKFCSTYLFIKNDYMMMTGIADMR